MSKWNTLAGLELKQVLRARSAWLMVALVLIAGGAAIHAGALRVQGQRQVLDTRETFLTEQTAHLSEKHAGDLGLLLYYLALPTEHTPTAWTPLAGGLRDVHPYSQHLRTLSLVPQLYAGELGNPLQQLTGSFDYAFVVTFLLPLLIIGLCYDVRSCDDALGTEPLLRSQPTRTSLVVLLRLVLRTGIVALVATFLLALAVIALQMPLDDRVGWWLLVLLGYIAFWSAVVLAVSALGRASAYNATLLMGVWLVLCVLAPALANAALMRTPVQSGIALTLTQREVMNAGWDKPKRATMEPFLRRRPAWRETTIPEDRFSWPWYYAMHEVADDHVASEVAAYDDALRARERWTGRIAMLLPPLAVTRLLSHYAGTDLSASLAYRQSVAMYHEQLKQRLYPLVFRGADVSALRLDALPRHRFAASPHAPLVPELAGTLALTLLLVWLGLRRARGVQAPRQVSVDAT